MLRRRGSSRERTDGRGAWVRPAAHARGDPPAATGGAGWTRVGAAAGMLAVTAALYWLVTDEGFRVTEAGLRIEGVHYADMSEVRDALGQLGLGPNVFRVRSQALATEVSGLPEVVGADVRAILPDRVEVDVHERIPILRWRSGAKEYLVDVEGVLFAPAAAAPPGELGSGAIGTRLPAVEDDRLGTGLTLGRRLTPEDLQVMRQLLALTPEYLGSSHEELTLRIDGRLGYVLEAPDGRWRAIFGHYSPMARPPAIVPGQVQCLRALLRIREASVARVYLPGVAGSCGTYLPGSRGRDRSQQDDRRDATRVRPEGGSRPDDGAA